MPEMSSQVRQVLFLLVYQGLKHLPAPAVPAQPGRLAEEQYGIFLGLNAYPTRLCLGNVLLLYSRLLFGTGKNARINQVPKIGTHQIVLFPPRYLPFPGMQVGAELFEDRQMFLFSLGQLRKHTLRSEERRVGKECRS